MRIASEIDPNGMTVGNTFMDAISSLILDNGLKKIIETGTYLGLGTTRAIIKGCTGGEIVYSIECNPKFYHKAVKNNEKSGVNFLLGLSVGKPQLPVDITFDVPEWVVVDHQQKNRNNLYRSEVNFPVADNMLDLALSKMNYAPDLVILDSAGHMGTIEFKYLMEKIVGHNENHSFYLALDDINHVKHYHSFEMIKDMPERCEIIFKTDEKYGSAIIKVS